MTVSLCAVPLMWDQNNLRLEGVFITDAFSTPQGRTSAEEPTARPPAAHRYAEAQCPPCRDRPDGQHELLGAVRHAVGCESPPRGKLLVFGCFEAECTRDPPPASCLCLSYPLPPGQPAPHYLTHEGTVSVVPDVPTLDLSVVSSWQSHEGWLHGRDSGPVRPFWGSPSEACSVRPAASGRRGHPSLAVLWDGLHPISGFRG